MEDTIDTKVQNEEDNTLGKGEKTTVIIKILLSIIVLFIGVMLIILSVGDSNCSNSMYQLNSYSIVSYNSMYNQFVGTNRSPSEVKALIANVRAHNDNQQAVSYYGKIALYYYGLEPSEDKSTENDNLTVGIIKNTYKYDIDVIAYHKGNGCIAKIRIIARKFSDDSPRIITDAKLDESLFTADFPDTRTSTPKVEDRKIKITDGSGFALGIFTSLLFAYYILSNLILLFTKEYSKKNAILELIFMVTSSVPIIIILFIESINELLIDNERICISCIYLALGIASILGLVEFVKTYKDYVKTMNFKKHSKGLIRLAFVVIIVYLLYGCFVLGNEFK